MTPTAKGVIEDGDDETLTLSGEFSQTNAGSYSSTAVCTKAGETSCSNYTLTNEVASLTIERAKTATTGSCNSGDYSSLSGVNLVTGGEHISYTNNSTSTTGSKTITVTADSNHLFSDGEETKTVSCTVSQVKQKSTASCTTGNRCASAGCETRKECYYCSSGSKKQVDGSWKCCSTKDGVETCSSMSYGRDSSCDCETYNRSISLCGCESWGEWGSWSDDANCSAGEASDHSTKTQCQDIYRIS